MEFLQLLMCIKERQKASNKAKVVELRSEIIYPLLSVQFWGRNELLVVFHIPDYLVFVLHFSSTVLKAGCSTLP